MRNIKIRRGKWQVINIKSRYHQYASHYVDAIRAIPKLEHAYEYREGKYIELVHTEAHSHLEADQTPVVIWLKFITYERIDNDFYDRKAKSDVDLQLSPNIFARKNEASAFFIPSIHKLVFNKNEGVMRKHLVPFLTNCLNVIEPEGFDIDVVKDRATIERIIYARCIFSLEADISYSNPGNLTNFQGILDEKIRESKTNRIKVNLKGSKEHPLQSGEDSLVEAIARLSIENGTLKAHIKENERGQGSIIDTGEHPRLLDLPNFGSILEFVSYIKNLFQ